MVIRTIFVKIIVDGNPPPCFFDQISKKPKTIFEKVCVTEAISKIFIIADIMLIYL